ncbi:MAG: hypothetical protein OHK93_008254 [Ramalina farinacea]|uniref:Uncharacterized protein n=1 Tax=Ramalina farinacea TaxID=258253 RepID=A0AA43QNA1_9LECA|nr:hypothetical protein [Ramalina farinacea]
MLQLSLSHEEWRFLQFGMILSSAAQIYGSAQRLYDKYRARQKEQELEKATKELERITEQLKKILRPGPQEPPPFLQDFMEFREEQRRRVLRGELPQSPEEFRLLFERELQGQQLQGPHELAGDGGSAAHGNEGHGIEGETTGG